MRERRHALPKVIGSVESLDDRVLLSALIVARTVHAPAAIHVTLLGHTPIATVPATNATVIQNGPLAKAGQLLSTLYQQFEQGGGSGTFHSSLSSVLRISGTSVEVSVRATPNQFPSLVSSMTRLGMQVVSSSAGSDTVTGYLPIGQLLNAAQLTQVASISPVNAPRLTL